MLYRKDLFEKNNIKVPTTWAEYKAAAEAIKKVNPNQFIATYGNDPGWITGLMWQGGCKPYKYNATVSKTNVTIKLNQASCKKVLNYWGDLASNKLVDDKSFWATDTGKGYDTGQYWTWVAAGWTPGYLAGQLKDTVGEWAVAPTPQWTAGADVHGDWGGSSFTVMKQTKNPALATKVAMELFPPQKQITKGSAWDIGLNSAFLYPLVTSVESNPDFANYTYKIFGPTAKVNPIYIHASGGHLLTLLNDLLDLSKIEAGRADLERVIFDPCDLTKETAALMAVRAAAKGIELSVSQSSTMPPAVIGDPSRVRQILINLLGNAVKFTERGRIDVAIERVAVPEDQPARWPSRPGLAPSRDGPRRHGTVSVASDRHVTGGMHHEIGRAHV